MNKKTFQKADIMQKSYAERVAQMLSTVQSMLPKVSDLSDLVDEEESDEKE